MSYRYCSACSKYIQKKLFNLHLKKHENGELSGKIDIEDENDFDKDDEDNMLIIDDEPVTEEAEDIEVDNSRVNGSSVTLDKIYNCFDCNRMFMSAEAQANHLRDVHGGEGGSVLLKLPRDKINENDIEQDPDEEFEKPEYDELVIDDM